MTALKQLRETGSFAPFVFLSGTIGEERAINAMRYGATDYVLKQNLHKLGVVVTRALEEYNRKKEIEQINERIRKEEERLGYVIKATNDVIWDYDFYTKELVISGAIENFGYKQSEIKASFEWLLSKIHPEDKTILEKGFTDLFQNNIEVCREEYRFLRGDGEFAYILNRCYVIRDKNNKPVRLIGSMMDLTDRKKNEEELLSAKIKAELSEKLKSEFLAQMSHEIRTPLGIILSYADLLAKEFDFKRNPDKKEIYDIVVNAGRRLVRTVDSILNMSELHLGSYQTDIKSLDIYKDILLPLYREYNLSATQKKIGYNLRKETNKTVIYSDSYSITQVFSNLIDNAVKYTLNGLVEIKIARDENDKLIVEITDTGIGISEDFLNHMFEPFRQEEQGYSRSFEGNGLGLALVKKYCDLINAELFVESKKNLGSRFMVRFS